MKSVAVVNEGIGMNIDFIIQGELYSTKELLEIPTDYEGIMDAISSQPGMLAWIGVEAALADANEMEQKKLLDSVMAELDADIREEAAINNEKLSEAKVLARVKSSEDYMAQVDIYTKAYSNKKVMDAIYEAFKQRGTLIATLAGMQRDERKAILNSM